MTETNTDTGRCASCHDKISNSADRILKHYLDNHTDSHEFREFVDTVTVSVDCTECGEYFISSVRLYSSGSVGANAYCPECRDDNPLAPLVVNRLTIPELVEYGNLNE